MRIQARARRVAGASCHAHCDTTESGTGTELTELRLLVAVSSMRTLPCETGSPAVLKLNVDCHCPGPIFESCTIGVSALTPNAKWSTLVDVMTEIVIG